MIQLELPSAAEYAPFYQSYIDKVDGDAYPFLEKQMLRFIDYCSKIPDEKTEYRYDEGKWSIKEVVGHCIDTERVMAYRLLRISRKDFTPLPGFDENDYVKYANFDDREWPTLLLELHHLRAANLQLISNLRTEQLDYTGVANTHAISVRALIYIIAGHLEHHFSILTSRYVK